MKTPYIDLKELERLKKENFRERLEFIEKYVKWLKKKSNKEWSSQQKDIIDNCYFITTTFLFYRPCRLVGLRLSSGNPYRSRTIFLVCTKSPA